MGGMEDLGRHAKEQYGVVSRAQVLAALKARSSIAWKVSTGELERVHELVYRLRGTPPSWQRTATEGLFVSGEGSVLSHQTAAWLHKLDGFDAPGIIHLTAPRSGVREFSGTHIHRPRGGPGNSVIASGFPITTVQRTIVDLAGTLTQEALELALDSAQRRYKRFGEWLDAHLKDLNPRGTPGLLELRSLLALRLGIVTDSPLEVKVLRMLRAAGLKPCSEPCIVMDENGAYVIRLDFAWPELKVALHVDSYLWHHQRERFDRDARQRSKLQKLGWRCITVTNNTLKERVWLDDLRGLLNQQTEFALY